MSAIGRLRYIYIPQVLPYFFSACITGVGFAWKSGIAAEILAVPKNAIGTMLYESKIYLETTDLFAWDSSGDITQLVFLRKLLCARFSLSASDGFAQVKGDPEEVFSASLSSFVIVWSRVVIITGISLLHIWKGYHTEVLKDVTAELPSTGLVLLTGPSGCGKTTLSHLILGLIKPDRGEIKGTEGLRFSAVFQENRLFPGFTVADNINAPLKQKLTDSEMDELLNKLGLSGIAQQYPNELSGGMQRRVAFARALALTVTCLCWMSLLPGWMTMPNH